MRFYGVRSVADNEPTNMNRRNTSRLLPIILWGVSVLNVSANGFRLASQDAFATARGEAFAATADNASAIYYNPAGITQLTGNSLRAGLYGIYLNQTFQPTERAAQSGHNLRQFGQTFASIPQLFLRYTPQELSQSVWDWEFMRLTAGTSVGRRTQAFVRSPRWFAEILADQSGDRVQAGAQSFHWRRCDGGLWEN